MKLEDFIGSIVISTETKRRYVLSKITSPEIIVKDEFPDKSGYRNCFCFKTINGDPIKNGVLVFEDNRLTDPFKKAYNDYCHSKDAYYEEIGHWMRIG